MGDGVLYQRVPHGVTSQWRNAWLCDTQTAATENVLPNPLLIV